METTNGNKNGASVNGHRFVFDEFEIDPANRLLLRDGEPIALTGKVFDVLVVFIENPGRLLDKDELLEKVWRSEFVEEGNLARNVSTLRKALGDTGKNNKYIATVQGRGYRFVADVTLLDESNEEILQREGDSLPTGFGSTRFSKKWVQIIPFAAIFLLGVGFVVLQFGFNFGPSKKNLSLTQPKMTKLTQSGNVYAPFISPDGQYLAYARLGGNASGLCVRQISTGSVMTVLPSRPNVKYWAIAIAPDNSFLYYILKEENVDYGNVYRIPLLGGQPHKIAELADGALTVSPDGRQLAFVRIDRNERKSSIVIVNNDGTDEKVIDSAAFESLYYSLDWSPDGKSFIYSLKRSDAGIDSWQIAELPVAGGAARLIGKPLNSKIVGARWLPDKNGLLVNAVDEDSRQPQIYYLSYPSGEMHRITNDLNYYYGITVTRDGRLIVAMNTISSPQIWSVPDGDVRGAVKLTDSIEKHYDTLVWDNSGQLVFDEDENSSYDNCNIWRMRQDGAEPQQLTFGSGNNKRPTVSSDGKTIVFVSHRSGKGQLWRMDADGNNLAQLTNIPYKIDDPQFLSDGRRVIFSVSINGITNLWQVSINGGEALPALNADVYQWAVSPDGARLAYSTFDKQSSMVHTYILSLEQNKIDLVLDISPETWMQWSNDGNAVYFNTSKDDVKNIWRQNLDGSKPTRVTDFDSERVVRFAWSRDGKNLACIRHTTTFDAVMFRLD